MINDTCDTCVFLLECAEGPVCRRYPPVTNSYSYAIGYPSVYYTQPACGEYRPKALLTPVDMITEEAKKRTREGYHRATPREKMVLDLLIMSEDTSSKSIAARLGISSRVVDTYITQVREKKIPSENRHHLVKLLRAAMR